MKAIADVYTECQLDKAERFRKKFVTGLAPRSRKKFKDKQDEKSKQKELEQFQEHEVHQQKHKNTLIQQQKQTY